MKFGTLENRVLFWGAFFAFEHIPLLANKGFLMPHVEIKLVVLVTFSQYFIEFLMLKYKHNTVVYGHHSIMNLFIRIEQILIQKIRLILLLLNFSCL
jgi:hypothetical protein